MPTVAEGKKMTKDHRKYTLEEDQNTCHMDTQNNNENDEIKKHCHRCWKQQHVPNVDASRGHNEDTHTKSRHHTKSRTVWARKKTQDCVTAKSEPQHTISKITVGTERNKTSNEEELEAAKRKGNQSHQPGKWQRNQRIAQQSQQQADAEAEIGPVEHKQTSQPARAARTQWGLD